MSTHDGYSDYFELKDDKSFGMHLAWAEGWGYAFSTMAQAYYFSEYQGMTNREVFIDTNISTSEEEEGYKGEFQEPSVKAFLWNLVDQSSLNPPEEDSEEPVEPEHGVIMRLQILSTIAGIQHLVTNRRMSTSPSSFLLCSSPSSLSSSS